jgi:hypothetical protein
MNRRLDLPQRLAHDDDTDLNPSGNPSFEHVLDARLSRRSLLRGGVGTAATALLGGWGVAACGGDDAVTASTTIERLSFATVPKGLADAVVIPTGYSASVLYALGDPLDATAPTPTSSDAPATITTAWSTSACPATARAATRTPASAACSSSTTRH